MSKETDEIKRTEARNASQNKYPIAAAAFIIAGIALVIANISGMQLTNWWALFMIIPIGFFAQYIYDDYQTNGRLTQHSTGSIIVIVCIVAGAAAFLFEAVTWGNIWPLGLVIAGIAMFFGNRS